MTTNTSFPSQRVGTAIAMILSALLLAACGGSNGDSAAPAPGANGEVAMTAKTRALTAFDVTVTPYKASASADSPSRFEVKLSDAASVAGLSAQVGKDYDSATPATVTSSG